MAEYRHYDPVGDGMNTAFRASTDVIQGTTGADLGTAQLILFGVPLASMVFTISVVLWWRVWAKRGRKK